MSDPQYDPSTPEWIARRIAERAARLQREVTEAQMIDLGTYTFNLADITPTGEVGARQWTGTGDPIDLGPGAHLAEVYAEITAFDLDGASALDPNGTTGTRVAISLSTSPSIAASIWQKGDDNAPGFFLPEDPSLPQSVTVGDGILSRYVQVLFTVGEFTTPPGADATITFNMSLLITTNSTLAPE
jgi:hypothetical protein